jgi:ABC-type phosphate transport system substrate-binding protein
MCTRPTNVDDDDDVFVFATSAASNELSIRSSSALSLFWKLRFHDLQKPWPSTRVNADGGGGGAAADADDNVGDG